MEKKQLDTEEVKTMALIYMLFIKSIRGDLTVTDIMNCAAVGVDFNYMDLFCESGTLLHIVCGLPYTKPEIVQALISAGADVNLKNQFFEQTPLHCAVRSGSLPVIKELIKAGADINARDVNKDTPLTYIAETNDIENMKYMIRKGADISLKNHEGKTPLDIFRKVQSENIDWLEKAWEESVTKQKSKTTDNKK